MSGVLLTGVYLMVRGVGSTVYLMVRGVGWIMKWIWNGPTESIILMDIKSINPRDLKIHNP